MQFYRHFLDPIQLPTAISRLLVLALVHELLRTDRVDVDFLARYTNAPWLIVRDPGGPDDGLVARDDEGKPLAWDRARGAVDAALPDHLETERQLLDGLPEADREQLAALLRRLLVALGHLPQEP